MSGQTDYSTPVYIVTGQALDESRMPTGTPVMTTFNSELVAKLFAERVEDFDYVTRIQQI